MAESQMACDVAGQAGNGGMGGAWGGHLSQEGDRMSGALGGFLGALTLAQRPLWGPAGGIEGLAGGRPRS